MLFEKHARANRDLTEKGVSTLFVLPQGGLVVALHLVGSRGLGEDGRWQDPRSITTMVIKLIQNSHAK